MSPTKEETETKLRLTCKKCMATIRSCGSTSSSPSRPSLKPSPSSSARDTSVAPPLMASEIGKKYGREEQKDKY